VGPAIAGVLVAIGDVTWAFILNAISFGIVGIVLWRLPRPERAPAKAEPAATGGDQPAGVEPRPSTLDLLRPVARPFGGVVLVNSAASFAFGGLSIVTVVLAVDVLKAGEGATGYLNAAIGVGGLIGALISGALVLRRSLAQPLLGGAVTLGLGLAVLGLVPNLGVALVAIGAAALGSLLVDVSNATIFQRTIPDEIRGRALGVNHTIAIAAYAVGAFLAPILLAGFGAGPVLVSLALVAVAGAVGGTLLIGAAATQAPPARPEAMRLARLPIFAGLPTPRLDAAIAKVDIQPVKAGEIIVREGDPADRFYVIVDGDFAVTQRDPGGPAERHLRTLGSDDVFGEIGLLTGRPRTATVTAEKDGTLLVLNGADFLELVGSASGVGSRLLGLYAPAGQASTSAAVGAPED
jgi:hypothetical protein